MALGPFDNTPAVCTEPTTVSVMFAFICECSCCCYFFVPASACRCFCFVFFSFLCVVYLFVCGVLFFCLFGWAVGWVWGLLIFVWLFIGRRRLFVCLNSSAVFFFTPNTSSPLCSEKMEGCGGGGGGWKGKGGGQEAALSCLSHGSIL